MCYLPCLRPVSRHLSRAPAASLLQHGAGTICRRRPPLSLSAAVRPGGKGLAVTRPAAGPVISRRAALYLSLHQPNPFDMHQPPHHPSPELLPGPDQLHPVSGAPNVYQHGCTMCHAERCVSAREWGARHAASAASVCPGPVYERSDRPVASLTRFESRQRTLYGLLEEAAGPPPIASKARVVQGQPMAVMQYSEPLMICGGGAAELAGSGAPVGGGAALVAAEIGPASHATLRSASWVTRQQPARGVDEIRRPQLRVTANRPRRKDPGKVKTGPAASG